MGGFGACARPGPLRPGCCWCVHHRGLSGQGFSSLVTPLMIVYRNFALRLAFPANSAHRSSHTSFD